MQRYAGLALLALAVLVEPLNGWDGVWGLHLVLFLAGVFVLRHEPGFRHALPVALLVMALLSLFAGARGIGHAPWEGGASAWRTAGAVRLPYALGPGVVSALNGVGFVATVAAVAVFLVLLDATRPAARRLLRPVAVLVGVGCALLLADHALPLGLSGLGFPLLWVVHLAMAQVMMLLALRLHREGGGPKTGALETPG